MKLWKIGLLTFILGGLLNAVLIKNEIGGIVRELIRLIILTGVALFIGGIARKILCKTHG